MKDERDPRSGYGPHVLTRPDGWADGERGRAGGALRVGDRREHEAVAPVAPHARRGVDEGAE